MQATDEWKSDTIFKLTYKFDFLADTFFLRQQERHNIKKIGFQTH